MSKQACKRVRRALGLEVSREPLPAFAWPGGYPMYYLCFDGEAMCPACVNANIELVDRDSRAKVVDPRTWGGWAVEAADVNWEDDDLVCTHCNKLIESACGEVVS